MATMKKSLLSSSSINGDTVRNKQKEELGEITDLMICCESGKVAYAVMTSGGFLGMGNKLFAIPFSALNCDCENKCFVLDASKTRFENADGFDQDNWPDMGNKTWEKKAHKDFDASPYWS